LALDAPAPVGIPAPIHTPASAANATRYGGVLQSPPDPPPVPALRVPVEFEAPDSGVAELTWGQMEIWLAMTRQGWLRLGGTKPLPPGTTVQEIADELHYLVTRYAPMRTLLRLDENGRPTQEVFGSGQIDLEIYDADDGVDADAADEQAVDETVATVLEHYQTKPRDYEHEWPVRMGLVRRRGELTHMVVQICHLVTDGGGGQVMAREVPVRETAPVEGVHHLELARWQNSEAGRRHHAMTARHWEKILRTLPPSAAPECADPREPRHWSGKLDSPALYLSVPVIAERTQVDSSTVLMALYAIALGRVGVLSPAVIRPLVHNRFRPGLANLVCNIVQSGICVLDVADVTVDEAVRRARRGGLTAYKYAYFNAEEMAALFNQVAAEQGPHLGVTNFFNDRRTVLKPAGAPVSERRLREAADAASFSWFEKKDNPHERLFLHVEDVPEGIRLQICADTHHVSPENMEAVAREMQAVAVEAALDPSAPTGVSPR
jgi:condensation domain-containing protein